MRARLAYTKYTKYLRIFNILNFFCVVYLICVANFSIYTCVVAYNTVKKAAPELTRTY